MKRFLTICGTLLFSVFLVGCGEDSNVGLVQSTALQLNTAAGKIRDIKSRVKDAIETSEKSGKKLDLTEAIDSTKALKDTAEEFLKLKRRIDAVREKISPEEKKAYADKERNDIMRAFKELNTERDELRAELAKAEKMNKTATKELRDKLTEAEAPFEAMGRAN